MKADVVITGGGTGGHLFPMQALADEFARRGTDPKAIHLVGSRRGQEGRVLGALPYDLTLLPGRGLRRSLQPTAILANISAVFRLVSACVVAVALQARWRPRAVVAVGGYASFPAGLAAVILRRPLVVVELDAAPGAANRVLARHATLVCRAFAPAGAKELVTGAPLRAAIEAIDRGADARRAAKQALGVDPSKLLVVVMTGSLGAQSVNTAVPELVAQWGDRHDLVVWHVTGRRDAALVASARPNQGGVDYRTQDFADDMPALWAACDVAVCRAGAATVAELACLGIPSVLVPLPNAPGDHQTRNAEALASVGGAVLVRDADCTGDELATVLGPLLENEATRNAMAKAAAGQGHRGATTQIIDAVLRVAR